MNFDEAITAHSAWKLKLANYLRKRDNSLNPSELALDNKCPLGQWIYGEGSKHSNLKEYGTLKSEHARFHKAVAEVVRHADAGKSVAEETALGSKSEFATASSCVIKAMMDMKIHAK